MKDSELLSLLGLKLALENQANQQSSSNASLSIPETMQQWQPGLDRGGLDPDEPMPKAATHINLQEFGDSYILTCKTNPTHSVHSIYLSCPMMPIGCFENCKRICEPTGCVREAGLRNVVCHAVHYSEQQGSVRQFEYKMNKYDKNITGKWSCFHAGVRSQIINVEAQARTSELSQHSGTNRFQFVHSRFWSDERLNSMPKQQPTNKTTAVSQRSVSGWSTMQQNETRGQQYSSLIGKRLYYVHPTGIHQLFDPLGESSLDKKLEDHVKQVVRHVRKPSSPQTQDSFSTYGNSFVSATYYRLSHGCGLKNDWAKTGKKAFENLSVSHKYFLPQRSTKPAGMNSVLSAGILCDLTPEVIAEKVHRQQTWLTSTGVDVRPPSCSTLPDSTIKNSHSCQFGRSLRANSSRLSYCSPSIARLPGAQPDLPWNSYGVHRVPTESEVISQ
ncbi:hypothetical protein X801_04224, partial [Opisthorchis viverrini]